MQSRYLPKSTKGRYPYFPTLGGVVLVIIVATLLCTAELWANLLVP
jgi:hypothetical protein